MASYKFTSEADEQIKLFCYRSYTTVTELFSGFGSSYNTYYSIKKRWVISLWTVKKLKAAWVPVFIKEMSNDE